MLKKNFIILQILFLGLCFPAISQVTNPKQGGDIFHIKDPEIQTIESDTNVIDQTDGNTYESYSDKSKSVFDPRKHRSIVAEDTSTIEEGEIFVVEGDEEYREENDSTWITVSSAYDIWDSGIINPYRIDHSRFKDTVQIVLYDSLQGRNWYPPLKSTFRTDDFGPRRYRWHYGTDLELDIGDSIFAPFDGIVRISSYEGKGYGNYIVLRHYNGLETLYGHLTKSLVDVGQYVKAGEYIGKGGNTGRSTGPHLHFEVRFEGTPIDPEYFFDFKEEQLHSRVTVITQENFNYLTRYRKTYYHRVRGGETLSSISKKYRVPVSKICRMNGISSKTRLRPGRRLRIR